MRVQWVVTVPAGGRGRAGGGYGGPQGDQPTDPLYYYDASGRDPSGLLVPGPLPR
jgi:hypothetical protein